MELGSSRRFGAPRRDGPTQARVGLLLGWLEAPWGLSGVRRPPAAAPARLRAFESLQPRPASCHLSYSASSQAVLVLNFGLRTPIYNGMGEALLSQRRECPRAWPGRICRCRTLLAEVAHGSACLLTSPPALQVVTGLHSTESWGTWPTCERSALPHVPSI